MRDRLSFSCRDIADSRHSLFIERRRLRRVLSNAGRATLVAVADQPEHRDDVSAGARAWLACLHVPKHRHACRAIGGGVLGVTAVAAIITERIDAARTQPQRLGDDRN